MVRAHMEVSTSAQAAVATDADTIAVGIVEGTILGGYRFERYKSRGDESDERARERPPPIERLIIAGAGGLKDAVARAALVAGAANRARDLQNRPANDLTPTTL